MIYNSKAPTFGWLHDLSGSCRVRLVTQAIGVFSFCPMRRTHWPLGT